MQAVFFYLLAFLFSVLFRFTMKKRRNLHYYPGRKRQPYVFEKMIQGKRISRAFSTAEAAEAFANRFESTVRESGTGSLVFDSRERAVWEKIKKLCGDFDPLEAVRYWKAHYRPEAANAPTAERAFEEFLSWQEKSGRSFEHIRSLKASGRKFLSVFSNVVVSKITTRALLDWLYGFPQLSPRSIQNLWTNTRNFLSWCRSAKNWLSEVPEIDPRLLPMTTRSRTEIWTLPEATAAIRFIEKNYPALVPHYALRLFAGLRASEASRMRWEWIDFEKRTILIPARDADGKRVCKTGDDWLILPTFLPDGAECVFSWLAHYRTPDAVFVPAPYTNAGIKIARACKWKRNVMRHTFATMLSSYNHDDGKTILATRHTNTQTLKRHYKGVNQTIEDSTAFFALRPEDKQLDLAI